MNRVTIKLLKKAFKYSGIIPTEGEYGIINQKGKACGCAFTALVCNEKKIKGIDYVSQHHRPTISTEIYKIFDGVYHPDYIKGFITGFDDDITDLKNTEKRAIRIEKYQSEKLELVTGFTDGREARRHFLKK